MNRKEWYTKYQAARILASAKFYNRGSCFTIKYDTPARQLVWDITYKAIEDMGHDISNAVFNLDELLYDISTHSWAARYNTRAFNRRMPIRESKKKWLNRY